MAIYTPRGLKIRIDIPYAFGLMARLHPKVTSFKILKTTEGIESLPGMLAFIAGMIGFGLHISPLHICIVVAACQIAGTLINVFGLFIGPGLVGLGTLYSYLTGYGIYFIAVIITGFVLEGWQVVIAFFGGKLVAVVIGQLLEFWRTKLYQKLTGHALTGAEVNFFNAYRLHASRLGVTTDIDLSESESRRRPLECHI